MSALLNKVWRSSNPSQGSSGFTPINLKPTLQNIQDSTSGSDHNLEDAIHQGNYIRPIQANHGLSVQMALKKSSVAREAEKPKHSKKRKAKNTLEPEEVLSVLAQATISTTPTVREVVHPGSPKVQSQVSLASSATLLGQRSSDIPISPKSAATPKKQARPSTSRHRIIDPQSPNLYRADPSLYTRREKTSRDVGDRNEDEAQFFDDDHHSLQSDSDEVPDGEYEVEAIYSHRYRQGILELHVKWKGYGENENTWEPEPNLADTASKILEFYFRSVGGRPEPKANVGRARTGIARVRASTRQKSNAYQEPSLRVQPIDAWSPPPPAPGNWDEYIVKIEQICKPGEDILVGVIWITEDNKGRKHRTLEDYGLVKLAAPTALLNYFEGTFMFEDTPELGVPRTTKYRPEKTRASSPKSTNTNDSRSRKRTLKESQSSTLLPTRSKKIKG